MSMPNNLSNTTSSEPTSPSDALPLHVSSVVRICFSVILVFVMFGIGCAADVENGYKHFKKPAGICVGIFNQLIIMPLLALFFVFAIQISDVESIAVLIQGTAPGGMISNVMTYWIGGDVNLSITMTALTTVLAIGSMPLWLLIFSNILNLRKELRIPYDQLGIALGIMVLPILLGALVKRYKSQTADKITKILTVVGTIAIVVTLVVSGIVSNLSFIISWQQWTIAAVTPVIGTAVGYGIACIKPFKLDEDYRRTIGIETGMQNCQISMSILVITYSGNIAVYEEVRLYPLINSLFQIVWGGIAVGVVRLWAKRSHDYVPPVTVTVEESKEHLHTSDLGSTVF